MPETITIGHVLTLLGPLAGLYALWWALIRARHRGFGGGTPQHASGRDGRRYALWDRAATLLFFALGGLTPLCRMATA